MALIEFVGTDSLLLRRYSKSNNSLYLLTTWSDTVLYI